MRRVLLGVVLASCGHSPHGAAPSVVAVSQTASTDVPSSQTSWVAARSAARTSLAAKDFVAYRAQLQPLYDRSGSVWVLRDLARADALLGDRARAIAELLAVAAMGVAIDAEPSMAAVRAEVLGNRAPVSHARAAVSLPHEDLIAEDIAYDASRRTFLVSSVRHRKILAVDADGHVRDFVEDAAGALGGFGGLAVRGDELWATTAWLPQTLGYASHAARPTGLVAFDLRTGALRERVVLPATTRHEVLSDLAVSRSGTLFASDSTGGDVYTLGPEEHALSRLTPAGAFVSPQTPAPSLDGRSVFVPDYVLGIASIDLTTRAVKWLGRAESVTLTGIDGLYVDGSTLVAVQNGVEPPRVVRLTVSDDGTRVLRAEVLERATPGLGEPTHGVIVDGTLHFVANAGWDRFDDDGQLRQGAPADAPAIWTLMLPEPRR